MKKRNRIAQTWFFIQDVLTLLRTFIDPKFPIIPNFHLVVSDGSYNLQHALRVPLEYQIGLRRRHRFQIKNLGLPILMELKNTRLSATLIRAFEHGDHHIISGKHR